MPTQDDVQKLVDDLQRSGFQGDIEHDYASRIVAATDNSIYQLTPQVIVYPRTEQDINRLLRTINNHRSYGFTLCARGGGTGTNGQSLTDNLLMDCSRYLNKIIDFSISDRTVTVQPGVVLDQLNAFLKPHGLFFPVDISSSSRATIGGMVATDASGKGSLIYGKTSRYIESLDVVLFDGSDYQASAHTLAELTESPDETPDYLLPIFLQLAQHQDEINRVFPDIDRGLTGYNLQQAIAEQDVFNPCYLLAGSEGTLAITRRIKLKLVAPPTHTMLSVIFYRDFNKGLEHIQQLLQSKPAAIEMLDEKILSLAKDDSVWFSVKKIFGDHIETDTKAVNYIEYVADSEQALDQQQQDLQKILEQGASQYSIVTNKVERDADNISAMWQLRKRAVGLLGNSQHGKRGIAFVEDSAVPARNLSQYITGFRKILDQHKLEYGMYGHADAGVLHVRPALDLLQQHDRDLIRTISDQVAQLARRNGGVLWGEHGRGLRGEYTPLFFGKKLYPLLCEIKNHFDPFNLLNSGKLVSPSADKAVIKLDEVTYRGQLDSQISQELQVRFDSSLDCNGNGSCFHWSIQEAMCPSYKATRNKLYSPKGRAALLREWARLKSTGASDQAFKELENSLFKSLQHCLSCKSCTSSCPLKVDIPELKSRFLQSWHENNRFSFSTLFVRYFEQLISVGHRFPVLSNALIKNYAMSSLLKITSGLHKLPEFSRNESFNSVALPANQLLPQVKNPKAVILLRDNYMQSFDRPTLLACCQLLKMLGYQVYVSDIIQNAKILHVKGFRKAFKKQAIKVMQQIQQLQRTGLPLISTETVMRLMFDAEYADALAQLETVQVHSIESFLWSILQQIDNLPEISNKQVAYLFPHCMEQTTDMESSQTWKKIFNKLGVDLQVINAGCCGMSGLFGHEIENEQLSEDIFSLCWQPTLESSQNSNPGALLASGFSCRCQCHNHGISTQHPVEYIVSILIQNHPGVVS